MDRVKELTKESCELLHFIIEKSILTSDIEKNLFLLLENLKELKELVEPTIIDKAQLSLFEVPSND